MIKKPKEFQVLKTWKGKELGTTIEFHQLVKCPDCNYEFVRDVSEGCFHSRKNPWACPKCNYPWTYYEKLREKLGNQPKPKEDPEPFNPTARFGSDVEY